MVRAAASGAIDFAEADPRDRWWWTRTNLILEELARRDRLELLKSHGTHWAGLLANSRIELEAAQAGSREVVTDILKNLLPWQSAYHGSQDMIDAWHAEYGDPNSPENLAMIEQAIETMNAAPISPTAGEAEEE